MIATSLNQIHTAAGSLPTYWQHHTDKADFVKMVTLCVTNAEQIQKFITSQTPLKNGDGKQLEPGAVSKKLNTLAADLNTVAIAIQAAISSKKISAIYDSKKGAVSLEKSTATLTELAMFMSEAAKV